MTQVFSPVPSAENNMFWRHKKVLVTGHTGFKGAWLSVWLKSLGAIVCGYALEPPTCPNLFDRVNLADHMTSIIGDVADLVTLQRTIAEIQPDIIFHLAAQSLVRPSYLLPVDTYRTNVMGTVCLLEAARSSSARVIQVITSDKCYDNPETGIPLPEETPFGGKDPYSSSKGCAEIVVSAYRHSFFKSPTAASLASVRAGNVIGGGDWAEDRLIPDCIRQVQAGLPLALRHPEAIRPWQFVLEPLSGYLWLAQKQWNDPKRYGQGFNFGPDEDRLDVKSVAERFYARYGAGTVRIERDPDDRYEARLLQLDITKAKRLLGWSPVYEIETAIEQTARWYRDCQSLAPDDVLAYCQKQIADYTAAAQAKRIPWARFAASPKALSPQDNDR